MKKMIFIVVTALVMIRVYAGFGTEPIVPTQDVQNFTVTLNFVNPRDITQKCTDLGVPYDANGCNAFYTATNHCEVFVMMPRYVGDEDRMAIIGHEIMHCRYGRYHR